jgi:hypothetical protein
MTFTKRSFVALTMILGCVLGFSSTSFGADSTFDSDNEGWVSFQNGGAVVVHVATGGNPGGFISSVDISDDWGYVLAPITFNAPALYGGELTFDLRAFTSEPVSWPIIFDVRVGLVGDGLTLINESTTPTGQWTGFSFALDENSGWRKFSSLDQNYTTGAPVPTQAEIQGVLANLTGVYIAADYTNGTTDEGVTETTEIDNVRIVAESSLIMRDGFESADFMGWSTAAP